MIEYINRDLMREACGNVPEDEIERAIRIAAKFCEKNFSVIASSANQAEVSSFCASVLFINKQQNINGRDGVRGFSVERDYYNALTASCLSGEQPLPMIAKVRKPKKKFGVNLQFENELVEGIYEIDTSYECVIEEAKAILSEKERQIIFELDGEINTSQLMSNYGLSRSQADALSKTINKKLRHIESIFNKN